MLKDDLSIIVVCYDPYVDAIELNPYFLDKYWPDCQSTTIYVTSHVDVKTKHIVVKTNGDLSFHQRLSTALQVVKTKYVLLLLDDYFIDKKINNQLIERNISIMKKESLDYCELYTMFDKPEGEKTVFDGERFIKISKSRKYRITLQPSIFSKDLLVHLLATKPNSAWDAELRFMNDEFNKCDAYYALNNSFSITNYIDKGFMTRKGYKMLKREGLWNNQRKRMTMRKTLKKWIIRKAYRFVPQKLKDKIKGNDIIYKG